jgi:serine/threonine protein kinase
LHHPNIVQIFGVYIENNQNFVVMEYLPLGSLDDFIINKSTTLKTEHLIQLYGSLFKVSIHIIINRSFDVAAGMTYLEKLKIVHRDLALRNILLGIENVAKVSGNVINNE